MIERPSWERYEDGVLDLRGTLVRPSRLLLTDALEISEDSFADDLPLVLAEHGCHLLAPQIEAAS